PYLLPESTSCIVKRVVYRHNVLRLSVPRRVEADVRRPGLLQRLQERDNLLRGVEGAGHQVPVIFPVLEVACGQIVVGEDDDVPEPPFSWVRTPAACPRLPIPAFKFPRSNRTHSGPVTINSSAMYSSSGEGCPPRARGG